MIGIEAIASYVPEGRIDNYDHRSVFDVSKEFIDSKIGARFLAVSEPEELASDLALRSVQRVLEYSSRSIDDLDVLAVVTQNPDNHGLPHVSALVHKKLGSSKPICAFDISLGCSGYVYGLSVIRGIMEEAGYEFGILVTADPYSKIIDRNDKNTALLFGDASTATTLTRSSSNWMPGKPILQTNGEGCEFLAVVDGRFRMNGRQVFSFASDEVPKQIEACLRLNEITLDDIDSICLHQGSAAIVDAIAKKFPSHAHKFEKEIFTTGNTVSSSIPLLLEDRLSDPSIRNILICGFGVGLSWASNVLMKV